MTPDQLQSVVIDALEDIKGQDIKVFDAQPLTSMFDRVVIVSGTSNRQTRALAKNLHDKVKQAGGAVYGTEGEDTGEWVLVDLGDIIVHIMQPAIREYYRLEEIWGKHPINWQALKAKAAPKRKATAKKPITGKKGAKASKAQPTPKPVASPKTKSGKKDETKSSAKPPAKNKAASKSSTTKKPATKKPVSKSSGTKKPKK